jgi:hypothetical protein
MPAYVTFEDVRLRLVGKVRFQDGTDDDDNRMPRALAIRLIDEAEGQVEQDLSPRYATPFVHESANTFKALPDRPTKNIIRTLCELKSVIRILETDFGAGSAVDGEKYLRILEKRYRAIIGDNILAKFSDEYQSSRQWKFPPLPGLALNWFNKHADDGYVGGVYVSSSSDGDYPERRINDPAESFFNFNWDDEQ